MFPEFHTKGELGSEAWVALFHLSTTAIVNLPGFNQYEYSITNNKKNKGCGGGLGTRAKVRRTYTGGRSSMK